MPRDMFGDVGKPSVRLGSQAWYTVPLSVAAHVVLFGITVILPLLAADILPMPPTVMAFVAPPALPEAPPPPPAVTAVEPRSAAVAAPNPDAAPLTPPDTITPESVAPPLSNPLAVVGGIDLPGGGFGSGTTVVPLPPIPPVASAPPQPVRPGGLIKKPTKILHVPPVYPTIAQQARVEGIVIIEATIGTDGRVKDARVLRSQPLLEQAAIDAVMQWRFTPTLLNGAPVPVLMTVTVNFALSR